MKIPSEAAVRVLVSSHRRCALCYGLQGDISYKEGQIAHVNRNRTDVREGNLCFLCLPHHNGYDTKPSQSKGFTPHELRTYRADLYATLKDQPTLTWADFPQNPKVSRRHTDASTVAAFYSRRIRMYRAVKALIGAVVRHVYVIDDDLWNYAGATDEAIFLFDDTVAAYFHELYRKSVRLNFIGKRVDNLPGGEERNKLAQEQYDLLTWYSDQFGVLRQMLIPFLRS